MDVILEFLQSGVLPTVLLIVRALVPLLALYVVWRCYTSFKKGQRRSSSVGIPTLRTLKNRGSSSRMRE